MTDEFWLCLVLTTLAMTVTLPLLRRLRILDLPNSRSSHTVVVPRGGGVACAFGMAFALILASDSAALAMALPALALAAVGLLDDLKPLAASIRLVVQFAVAVLVATAAMGTGGMSAWWALGGALLFISYVNAFNFMDGINGISGLTACVCGGWYWSLGEREGLDVIAGLGAVICAAGLAFLPWNSPRAKVFLGDVGSYLFGALIATVAVIAISEDVSAVLAVAPMSIYLADTGWTLLLRARRRESLTTAHRDHAYQRVADRWGHAPAALTTAAFTLLCTVAGNLPPVGALGAIGSIAAFYLAVPWAATQSSRLRVGGK